MFETNLSVLWLEPEKDGDTIVHKLHALEVDLYINGVSRKDAIENLLLAIDLYAERTVINSKPLNDCLLIDSFPNEWALFHKSKFVQKTDLNREFHGILRITSMVEHDFCLS